MEAQYPTSFSPDLKWFYDNKDLSDAIIRCGVREFAVHKLVLFSHSDYFFKQLTGQWKESIKGFIDISDFDISFIEAMVYFMKHQDYNIPLSHSDFDIPLHATMYQIADKYEVQSLKKFARANFSTTVNEFEGQDKVEFPSVISLLWSTTPPHDRGLRDVVATASLKELDALMEKESFIGELTTNGPLAVGIIHLQKERFGSIRRYRCNKCNCTFDFGNEESLSGYTSILLDCAPKKCLICNSDRLQKVIQ